MIRETAKNSYDASGERYKNAKLEKKQLAEFYTTIKHLKFNGEDSITGKMILDLGCGSGELMLEIIKAGAKFVAGADISQTMLNLCRDQLTSIDSSVYSLTLCNCFDSQFLLSQFPQGQFSGIIMNWLINYAEDYNSLKSLFNSCRELLSPSGRIFGIFPNDSLIDHTAESIGKMEFKALDCEILEMREGSAISRMRMLDPKDNSLVMEFNNSLFRKETIIRTLEESGLEIIYIGPLDVDPRIESLGYSYSQFQAYTETIGVLSCFSAKLS